MKNWIPELKRRNVPKVAAVYVVVAWVIMQAADVMFPALRLPEWTITLVAALLIIGFPLALVLSWAFELTPDGIKPERSSQDSESRPRPVAAPLAGAIVVGLIGSGAWYFLSGDHDASVDASNSEALIERSIAVLPFVSLSTAIERSMASEFDASTLASWSPDKKYHAPLPMAHYDGSARGAATGRGRDSLSCDDRSGLIPSGVSSNAENSTSASGKPIINRAATRVIVHSGRCSAGNITSAACIMTHATTT